VEHRIAEELTDKTAREGVAEKGRSKTRRKLLKR